MSLLVPVVAVVVAVAVGSFAFRGLVVSVVAAVVAIKSFAAVRGLVVAAVVDVVVAGPVVVSVAKQ